MVVTGDCSAMLNAYVEILRASAGSRLIGLLPHRRPHADQVFAAVTADGGLTADQASLLNELYVLEAGSSTPLQTSMPRRFATPWNDSATRSPD